MGIRLYGTDVSGLIKKHVGDGMLRDTAHVMTLVSIAAGTRGGNLTAGTSPTSANHGCKGFISTKDIKSIGGTLVLAGDVVVLLIGDSIADGAVPVPEDKLVAESVTYRIKAIDRDPAAATYRCLCRKT